MPAPVKPSGRRAFSPKLATTFIVPSVTITVPPPVTMATVSGLIAAAAGCADSGSTRPRTTLAGSATPRAMTATTGAIHPRGRDRAMRCVSALRVASDLPPCRDFVGLAGRPRRGYVRAPEDVSVVDRLVG